MSDCTLSDGREITVNLKAFTIKEYRDAINLEGTFEERAKRENELICKGTGLTIDEFNNLSMHDFKVLSKAFYHVAREPLADPNSQSASTST